ncbi:hypothetical protein [uncultured Microscilla sp.]|uniref:hypothetical protein n=1 Tax=uncultured Microscilla sp. TaxID=432653 RepID=UPI002639B328|nr:hypothetical protein [uncultured Microscilla sp.]
MGSLSIQDLLLTPIYLSFILLVTLGIKSSIKDRNIRRYFMWGIWLKIFGAIALGIIYNTYYGGDTNLFFSDGGIIWRTLLDSPSMGLRLMFFTKAGDSSPELFQYVNRIYYYIDSHSFAVLRISAFFDIFSFHTYTINAVFFAIVSFTGIWCMFRVWYHLFPQLLRPLAVAIFFIPSVIFWGSGLLKDTITIGALGWMFYGFYFGIILRRKMLQNVLLLLLGAWVSNAIKQYVLLIFLPSALLWLFLQYRNRIKSRPLRIIMLPILMSIALPMGLLAVTQITGEQSQYNLDQVAKNTKINADWLGYVSEQQGGSGYSLGELDGTIGNMLIKFPQAVWLALFRPYLWEARNPFMLLSALESLFFLLLTFKVLLSVNLGRLVNTFVAHPVLVFSLAFTLVLAFASAISSNNFGTVVRYKIPFMPFYLASLYVLRYKLKNNRKLF